MKTIETILCATILSLGFATTPALAGDPILGVWITEPDRKDLVSHINIAPCGDLFCGTILEAFDAAGKKVETPNIGKKLFWGMTSDGGGKYSGGTAYIPLLDINAEASMLLDGNKLTVKGCKGVACEHRHWTR